jgi:hypothetical protein
MVPHHSGKPLFAHLQGITAWQNVEKHIISRRVGLCGLLHAGGNILQHYNRSGTTAAVESLTLPLIEALEVCARPVAGRTRHMTSASTMTLCRLISPPMGCNAESGRIVYCIKYCVNHFPESLFREGGEPSEVADAVDSRVYGNGDIGLVTAVLSTYSARDLCRPLRIATSELRRRPR